MGSDDQGTPGDKDKFSADSWKMTTVGFELAGSVVIFCLIGYFVDQRWHVSPWGILIGAITGIIVGLYLLIKEALMAEYSGRKGQAGEPGRQDDHDREPPKK